MQASRDGGAIQNGLEAGKDGITPEVFCSALGLFGLRAKTDHPVKESNLRHSD